VIFSQMEGKIHTVDDLINKWGSKDKDFSKALETFRIAFRTASGPNTRSLLEGLLRKVIRSKNCSIELATKTVLDAATHEARAQQGSPELGTKSNVKGYQAMMFNEAYMQCSGETYDLSFRKGCVVRNIEFSGMMSIKQMNETDPATLPGVKRLNHHDEEIRFWAWTWYFQDMVNYLCGPAMLDQIDIRKEKASYFITADPKSIHQLRMTIDADGKLMDIHDWIVEEERARNNLINIATMLKLDDVAPTENQRVANALRAFHPDFLAEWHNTFKHSKTVPIDTITPVGRCPIISWDIMKLLMSETQEVVK